AGNDLRQGLVTLPLIYALRDEQDGRIHVVEHILQLGAEDSDAIDGFVQWVAASPAIGEALDLARHYAARARALLSEFPNAPERAVLEELVDFVVARSH